MSILQQWKDSDSLKLGNFIKAMQVVTENTREIKKITGSNKNMVIHVRDVYLVFLMYVF